MFVNNSPQDLKQEGYMKNYADLIADTENTWDLPDDEESYIDTKYVDGEKVEYKIIFGNDNIVFIKAGAIRINTSKWRSVYTTVLAQQ